MNHGSLFSGIGGFDLPSEWMGWENVFHCEWEPFPRKILHHYWPNAISYEDITKTDFTIHRGQIDILTGGFPCQPYSTAGKRKGKEDERHLWPEMLRAIREIQPRWVVGENVRGLVSWNGGLVFDEVQTDLEAEGYEVQPFILPACAVNAPHRRDRVWFIAYSDLHGDNKCSKTSSNEGQQSENKKQSRDGRSGQISGYAREQSTTNANDLLHQRGLADRKDKSSSGRSKGTNQQQAGAKNGQRVRAKSGAGSEIIANSNKVGQQRWGNQRELPEKRENRSKRLETLCSFPPGRWENFPTESPVCSRNDGIPTELDGITFSKWRNESIKAYGNAVVPQVVLQIFKAIDQYENKKI